MSKNTNPIKSAKVYFDEKKGNAVLCVEGVPRGPSPFWPCDNGEFHTHAWVPIGSVSETMLLTERARRAGPIPQLVLHMLFAVNDIRNRYELMEKEHREAIEENQSLDWKVKCLVSLAERAIQSVVGEEHRLELLKSLSTIKGE